ncbi:hypothetical protein AB0I72_19510 [Nocardiopsis sp. NPDC049922]|uniref:hypothetical protein n=1 Tax=Nocardiopsis sp. NPDC049922 TaxID=3155157 RepID=UPI0033D5DA7E
MSPRIRIRPRPRRRAENTEPEPAQAPAAVPPRTSSVTADADTVLALIEEALS